MGFAFTGQGSQYAGMGRALYATQPTFRAALERCAALVKDELPQPLLAVLYPAEGEASPIDETGYTQPALFAIEYALAELWRSWGIQPAVVLGHSIGEYVAACVAGVFSLEDALRLVAARGRLMQALPAGGTMAAVGASAATVRAAIAAAPAVEIAAINGPAQVVIAGPQAEVVQVVAALEAQGLSAQPLTTSHAFHSARLEPMLDAFEAVAQTVTYHAPQIPVIVNLHGHGGGGRRPGDAGVLAAARAEHGAVGDEPRDARGERVRGGGGSGADGDADGAGAEPDERGRGGRRCGGGARTGRRCSTRWRRCMWRARRSTGPGFDRDYVRHKVALPTYPFQRERYWVPFSRHSRWRFAAESRNARTVAGYGQSRTQPTGCMSWRGKSSPLPPHVTAYDSEGGRWLLCSERSNLADALCRRIRRTAANACSSSRAIDTNRWPTEP